MTLSEFEPRPIEKGLTQEQLNITPKGFYDDNHSDDAVGNLLVWEDARRFNRLVVYKRCADARVKPVGLEAVSWACISAGGEVDYKFISDKKFSAAIALGHFDGDTKIPGQAISGCGGHMVKTLLDIKGIGLNQEELEWVNRYAFENIYHKDIMIQAYISAEKMANQGQKQSLAVVQDHLTLEMYPIALFQPKDGEIKTTSAITASDIADYKAEGLYANGIPTIDESDLPEVFQRILQANRQEVKYVNPRYPDLRKMQKVQKPRMILWSTDIRSARVKYPTLSSVPGSMFKIIMPRRKIESDTVLSEKDIQNCLNQLVYPLLHAVENHDDPEKDFSNTDRFVIETGSFEKSRELAQKAMGIIIVKENGERIELLKEWLKLKGRQIILLQSVAGNVNKYDYFEPEPTQGVLI